MKNLTILGANGYIGQNVVSRLNKKYKIRAFIKGDNPFKNLKNVQVFSGDVSRPEDARKVIRDGDVVLNLIGSTTIAKEDKEHFDVNVLGQQVIASICAEKNARVIYFSTLNLYVPGSIAWKETGRTEPQDTYSFTKKQAEEIYEFYSRKFGLNTVIFRLGSVYGPGHGKGVVHTMAESIKRRGIIEIPETEVARDFIYIDDVIDAIEKVLQYRKNGFHVFNIAGGKKITLAKLAGTIIKIFNKKSSGKKAGKVVRVKKTAYPAILQADISKAKKELGFKPKTGLDEGLQITLS